MSFEYPKGPPQPGRQFPVRLPLQPVAGESTPRQINFHLFLPRGYSPDGSAWPLLLFLHGAGERGNDLELVKAHGPPQIVESNPDFPFITVSPQCPDKERWNPVELLQLLDHVSLAYRVDPNRVYVTGLSMGGYGTFAVLTAAPERFAAAIPICGGGQPSQADKLKSIPIWAFHGAQDRIVPLRQSEEMVTAIQAAGGKVQLTVYPDVAHHSWTPTYNNPAIYDWLLSHRRV
jgi:predicted peptidase